MLYITTSTPVSSAQATVPARIPATAACRASFGALVSERTDARPALLLPHNVHAFIETDTSMTTSVRAYNKMYAFEHTNTLTHKNNARYKTLP